MKPTSLASPNLLETFAAIATRSTKPDLKTTIKEASKKMTKDKEMMTGLSIPPKFFFFANSQQLHSLIESVLVYCEEVNRIEKKQQSLEKECKERGLSPPRILSSEISSLQQKASQIALKFSLILLHEAGFKNPRAEQNFFETMTQFISRVIREYFSKEDFVRLEEEINRLFRTNAFNISKRKNADEETQKKEMAITSAELKKLPTANLLTRVERRVMMPRENNRFKYMKEKSDLKPNCFRLTPIQAVHARSPLISILLPTAQDRARSLAGERKKKSDSFMVSRKIDDRVNLSFILERELNRDT
eukprot:TRINITY_DN3111_c0_g1_i2.p1 TRINITY_DN3111_c0_g1~~TRINITY_DN3111_c0_g1_i2.p1  ORF type:complete len:304 (+),score=28.83 TRINITY_DN3111_c0_g1_i2:341-1252(+)